MFNSLLIVFVWGGLVKGQSDIECTLENLFPVVVVPVSWSEFMDEWLLVVVITKALICKGKWIVIPNVPVGRPNTVPLTKIPSQEYMYAGFPPHPALINSTIEYGRHPTFEKILASISYPNPWTSYAHVRVEHARTRLGWPTPHRFVLLWRRLDCTRSFGKEIIIDQAWKCANFVTKICMENIQEFWTFWEHLPVVWEVGARRSRGMSVNR